MTATLAPSLIRHLLNYDELSGKLFWLPRTAELWQQLGRQKSANSIRAWNERHAGNEAFKKKVGGGYRVGTLLDKRYYAHRVVWAWQYGEWPADELDHVDGGTDHNILPNLREVTRIVNCRNLARSRRNTSGATGVSWHKRTEQWRADICVAGRRISLGHFHQKNDAVAARKAAEQKYGFHPNHGRPACAQH